MIIALILTCNMLGFLFFKSSFIFIAMICDWAQLPHFPQS